MKRKITKCQQIANDIKNRISANIYTAGNRIPPELSLCEEYDASRITVRNAIKSLENEGVLYRIQGKGTYVKETNKKNRKLIAFLVENIYPQNIPAYNFFLLFLYDLIHKMETSAHRRGWTTALYNSLADEKKEKENIKIIKNSRPEAVIVIHSGFRKSYKYIEDLAKTDIPLVLIDRWYDSNIPISVVTTDNFEAGYKGTKALLEDFGCSHPVYFTVDDKNRTCEDRLHGFRTACAEKSIDYDIIVVPRNMHLDTTAEEAITEYLNAHPKTDGIFSISTGATTGIYNALKKLGIKDMSIAYMDPVSFEINEYNTAIITQSIINISEIAINILENYDIMERNVIKISPDIKIKFKKR